MIAVLAWLVVGWAALLLSSLVSMMAVFMGSSSADLRGLLGVQSLALPVALLAIALYLRWARRHAGGRGGLRLLWAHTPAWLVFVVAAAASLTLIAELTFVLVDLHTAGSRPWPEHVPALVAIVSAVALAAAVASLEVARAPEPESSTRKRSQESAP